jgi:hypothetical protein
MKKHLLSLILAGGLFGLCAHGINAQWVQTSGPEGGTINALAVNAGNIFAGSDNGIFLSTNNGSSWASVNSGLVNLNSTALLISGGTIFAGSDSGVFLSTNNGTNWTAANSGILNTHIVTL